MTTTYKYRVVVFKELASTPLTDYAQASRNWWRLKEILTDNEIKLEKVKDES